MSCNCKSEIEAKLLDRFKQQAPDATDHKVRLTGYTLLLGETITAAPYMEFEATANHPLKKGGFKEKRERQNMIFNYCPFCGASVKRGAA